MFCFVGIVGYRYYLCVVGIVGLDNVVCIGNCREQIVFCDVGILGNI